MTHDVFISYSHQDSESMAQVRNFLRENGLDVWTDEGIEPGTSSWKQAIENALLNTKSLIVLFSPDSTDSKWVRSELDFAELHKVQIFSLLVRGEEVDSVPFGYATHQWIDFRESNERQVALERLLAVIQGKPVPAPVHDHKKKISKPELNWQVFAAIAFVIILVVLALTLFFPDIVDIFSEPTATYTPEPTATNTVEPTATTRPTQDSQDSPNRAESTESSIVLPDDWQLVETDSIRYIAPARWVNGDYATFREGLSGVPIFNEDDLERIDSVFEIASEIHINVDWLNLRWMMSFTDEIGVNLPLEGLKNRYIAIFEDANTEFDEISTLSLPQGDAIRFDYQFAEVGSLDYRVSQYYIAHNLSVHSFMFGASNRTLEETQPIFDTVLASLQFVDEDDIHDMVLPINEIAPSNENTTDDNDSPLLEDWQTIETDNVSIALPSDWQSVQTSRSLVEETIKISVINQATADSFLSLFASWDVEVHALHSTKSNFFMGVFTNQSSIPFSFDFMSALFTASFDNDLVEMQNDKILHEQGEAMFLGTSFRATVEDPFTTKGYGLFFTREAQIHSYALIFLVSYEDFEENESLIEDIVASFQILAD